MPSTNKAAIYTSISVLSVILKSVSNVVLINVMFVIYFTQCESVWID